MNILLANPRGFCAGVDRAIEIVNRTIDIFGAPIYVRHEVVHNKYVVENLKKRGAVFVEELHQVPDNAVVIFSAHGVSQAVEDEAKNRGLKVFDATCPLVTKVHTEVGRFAKQAKPTILIGHQGHPEVEGTMGRYDPTTGGNILLVENVGDVQKLPLNRQEQLAYVTQTTLSIDDTKKVVDALREKFPNIEGPKRSDICYATQNRQDAVKELAQRCDLVLVVGSPNSSNSNRLKELAERQGVPAYLIDNALEINKDWLNDVKTVGITAGASAPEILIDEVIAYLIGQGGNFPITLDGIEEHIEFSVPKELRNNS